jgi:hypothetical protein
MRSKITMMSRMVPRIDLRLKRVSVPGGGSAQRLPRTALRKGIPLLPDQASNFLSPQVPRASRSRQNG